MKKENKFVTFVKKQNYVKELSIPEHIILGLNVTLSLAFFIVQLAGLHNYDKGPTGLTFVATITSIFSVMAGAKQRILCPFLGIVSSGMLVAINGSSRLFGGMVMHCFNIVMQTITLVIGYRTSNNKVSIQPRHLKLGIVIVYILGFLALSGLFTGMESFPGFYNFGTDGNKQPGYLNMFDAMVLMFTVAAAYPMFKKYDFVGGVYIVTDVAMAATGVTKGVTAGNPADQFIAGSMLVSSLSMTATCILGMINGKRSLNK